ncbi:MAG: DUF4384 domain-containing protein [Acidobacteriota bacterium]|nr:DUF4384 domain-containing protein [Acidobacteriota bacterium]
MKNLKFITKIFLITLSVFCIPVFAQDEQPASRSITSLEFKAKRPTAGGASAKSFAKPTTPKRRKAIAAISDPKRRYNLVKRIPAKKIISTTPKGNNPAKPVFKTEELGVTFWRLRPAAPDDEGAPLFPVLLGDKTENWTAGRVASTTQFQKGDRVRFTVESSRSGFLYIANREFYADGTTGEANIIFPTLRTRGGSNKVSAGSLIDIPSATEQVPYFTIKPRRADYAGEELIVLILPNELPNFEKELRAQPLKREILEKWFADWETLIDIYDAADGADTAYTEAEAQAANTTSRDLTQEEPLPQTIYRVSLKQNAPLFAAIRMQTKTP